MKRLLFALLVCWGITMYASAQSIGPSTLNASGGSATIGGNSHDWSVGEMTLVSTFASGSIIVTQGVLQPNEPPLGVNDIALQNQLCIWPNPATSVVNMEYSATSSHSLTYHLTDINGKLLTSKTFNTSKGKNTEQINIASLPNASYMLEVTIQTAGNAVEKRSFKVVKL
ncbi:T9SS type A sorting domain-containing protein [Polluticoccus soli]|uniref:T9SS type A sorting domain-containing protein n=1 Tax=Polluticoccus soli TaxID=3034150 RepID=UPI0023E30F61|nr:T9SS type A sorting domain-containing protein [Flavipsychrobacter sp. JY13-12]